MIRFLIQVQYTIAGFRSQPFVTNPSHLVFRNPAFAIVGQSDEYPLIPLFEDAKLESVVERFVECLEVSIGGAFPGVDVSGDDDSFFSRATRCGNHCRGQDEKEDQGGSRTYEADRGPIPEMK